MNQESSQAKDMKGRTSEQKKEMGTEGLHEASGFIQSLPSQAGSSYQQSALSQSSRRLDGEESHSLARSLATTSPQPAHSSIFRRAAHKSLWRSSIPSLCAVLAEKLLVASSWRRRSYLFPLPLLSLLLSGKPARKRDPLHWLSA